jgi:putative addiction module killer protein
VLELRLAFGPGYRIYGAREGTSIALLLCGGDKSSQRRDIAMARDYYENYRSRKNEAPADIS